MVTALTLRQALCDAERLRQMGCPGKMTLSAGREGIGQRETLSCGVASRKASADPPGSFGADMALRTCPKLGVEARPPRGPWTRWFSSRYFPMRTDSEGSVLAALSAAGGLSPSALERGIWQAEHGTYHRGLSTGASTWPVASGPELTCAFPECIVPLGSTPGPGDPVAFL